MKHTVRGAELSAMHAGCYRAPSSKPHEPAVTRNLFAIFLACTLIACTPTVKFATDKPIEVNLNVNIKHEIRIKVDKELDSVLSDKGGLF